MKNKFTLHSNQYIPYKPKSLPSGMPKCETYYYLVNENGKVVDKSTLKPYRGKEMNRYALFGSKESVEKYLEIVNKSIDRSPYPESFSLINWREKFPILAENFNKESWWKDKDYSGKPNFDVERFL